VLATRADRVIIDLEDAVAPEANSATRHLLSDWLLSAEARDVMVRVNAAGTLWRSDGLRSISYVRN
jgi:citrate lyase beta subunit